MVIGTSKVQNYQLDTFGYVHENNKNTQFKVEYIKAILDLTDPWRIANQDLKNILGLVQSHQGKWLDLIFIWLPLTFN